MLTIILGDCVLFLERYEGSSVSESLQRYRSTIDFYPRITFQGVQVCLQSRGVLSCSLTANNHSDPLRETVQCNATLAEIATNGYFPTSDDLRNLCSRDCLTSLQRLREKQEQACATSDIIVTGGIKYPPTLILDELISTFNYTCRKDS